MPQRWGFEGRDGGRGSCGTKCYYWGRDGVRVGADVAEMCLEVVYFSQHTKFCFPEIHGEAQPTTMWLVLDLEETHTKNSMPSSISEFHLSELNSNVYIASGPGMAECTFNPSLRKGEADSFLWVVGQPGLHSSRLVRVTKWDPVSNKTKAFDSSL